MNDGRYEIRAELPGVDPAKDVDVTARDGVLTIRAQRSEKAESQDRSKFSRRLVGSFGHASAGIKRARHQRHLPRRHPDRSSVGLTQAQPAEKRIHVSSGT